MCALIISVADYNAESEIDEYAEKVKISQGLTMINVVFIKAEKISELHVRDKCKNKNY